MRWRVLAADAADINPIDAGGADFGDNAQNSIEQEVATKTWTDHALDLLARGASQQQVVAKLAHDGCPDPEAVYQRALEHQASQSNQFDPEVPENPVGPEAENTDFNMPPQGVTAAAQPEDSMGVQGVDTLKQKLAEAEAAGDTVSAQQLRDQIKTMWQGYTGSVKVANFEGSFRAMDFDQWGRLVVAIETPTGIMQLDGEKAEPVAPKVSDEVSEIQSFIDSIPEVEPNSIESVTARIAGLQEARSRVVTALGRAEKEDLPYLIKMRTATAEAIKTLTSSADGIITPYEKDYLATQQNYERAAVIAGNGTVGGFDSPDLDPVVDQMVAEASTYNSVKASTEDAAILVAELPELMVHDAAAVQDLAESMVMERTAAMSPEAQDQFIKEFCASVEAHRLARAGQVAATPKVASVDADVVYTELANPENDGPAEGLFW